MADALAGRWTGRPRIVTLDLDIELDFAKRSDGTITGRLIGTNLGEIDQPLQSLSITEGELSFELPNWQPWQFRGVLTEAGSIVGALSSSQGGLPVTFRRAP
jgi:hypothetical protein